MTDVPPPPPGPARPRPPRRALRVALVLSLMVNLLLVGLFVGLLASGRGPGGGPRGFDLALGPLTEAMPPEERGRLRDALRGNERVRDLAREGRRQAVVDLAAAIRAEPFDRAAVAARIDAQTDRMEALQDVARGAWLDRVAAMSPEARAAYAERLESWSRRGPPPGG